MQPELIQAYVAALTGSTDTPMNWRALHDVQRGVPGQTIRATVTEALPWMHHWQSQGYGIFVTPAETDGTGLRLENVVAARANYVDLDNAAAPANMDRASKWVIPPSFVVNSSPGKFHVYWPVRPYLDHEMFSMVQRKLISLFDGDAAVNDITRVMRVPGTWHLKNPAEPWLVTCQALEGYARFYEVSTLVHGLQDVPAPDHGMGLRRPLGTLTLSAPGLRECLIALAEHDPNEMTHTDWAAFTAAWKQSVWLHCTPEQARSHWDAWCARYERNDPAANEKLWRSVQATTAGWGALRRKTPALLTLPRAIPLQDAPPLPPVEDTNPRFGEIIGPWELKDWFEGVYNIVSEGNLWTPEGRMNQITFNKSRFGGKRFRIVSEAVGSGLEKSAWTAATNGTVWTVPQVHRVTCNPERAFMETYVDEDKRTVLNIFEPPVVRRVQGDPSRWIRHVSTLLGDPAAFEHLCDFLAHNLLYPGVKVMWAPLIQSCQGAGKNVISNILAPAFRDRFHKPKVSDIAENGSKFNAWMEGPVFILADEMKVYEGRGAMMEILKEWISERRIEVQRKGADQYMMDNIANWMFFTNYKDAMPVRPGDRRIMPIFSPLQYRTQLQQLGWDSAYFRELYDWIGNQDGAAIVADWLMQRPVRRGQLPTTAPETNSNAEAYRLSRTPLEQLIWDNVEVGTPGFRGGWVSSGSIQSKVRGTGMRSVTDQTIGSVLSALGYHDRGLAPRAYPGEGRNLDLRSRLYSVDPNADVHQFGRMQGWM